MGPPEVLPPERMGRYQGTQLEMVTLAKILTQGPEPRNRRVTIVNITGLMAER
jgi:hypothetical protein